MKIKSNPNLDMNQLNDLKKRFIQPCLDICVKNNKKDDKESEVIYIF